MTFRPLQFPNQKVLERDQKLKNKKCKCHHHRQQICPKKIDKSGTEIDEMCERLYNENQRFKNKKQKQRQRIKALKQQKQMQGCTFAPSLYDNPNYFVSKSSFLQRELTWSESKQKKIKQQTERKKSLQTVGCQFNPKIIKNSDKIISSMKTSRKAIQTKNPQIQVSTSYMSLYNKQKNKSKSNLNTISTKKNTECSVIKIYQQTNASLDNEMDMLQSQIKQLDEVEIKPTIIIEQEQTQN